MVSVAQRMWARLSRAVRRLALLVPLVLTALALLLLPRPLPHPQPAKAAPSLAPPPAPAHIDDDTNILNEVSSPVSLCCRLG